MTQSALFRFAEQNRIPLREQEPLAAHTTFQIGGPARFFALPRTVEQLAALLEFARREEIRHVLLGNGSNLLAADEGYDGLVILAPAEEPVWQGEAQVTVAAGFPLARLSAECGRRGLAGLAFAQGIPGTVGGGVVMNAGAYGGQLSDTVVSTLADTPAGRRTISGGEHGFGYRQSIYAAHPDWTVLRATFRLTPGNREEIQAQMADFAARRREKQPLEYPSAGSTFRRPEGHFAGKLIEDCGLKGFSIGGAQVSEKHAGFIINRGGATCRDVLSLMEEVSRQVLARTGVRLEPEVRLLG